MKNPLEYLFLFAVSLLFCSPLLLYGIWHIQTARKDEGLGAIVLFIGTPLLVTVMRFVLISIGFTCGDRKTGVGADLLNLASNPWLFALKMCGWR